MIQISPTSIPNIISPSLRRVCNQLVENANPVFVDVKTVDYSRPNKCTFNVKEQIQREGGTIEYGWSIAIWPKVLLDCIGHAVHKINGYLKCVTPEKDGASRILFLPDPTLTFDFDDTEARMPHRMIPLNNDPDVGFLIAHEKREFEIICKYPRGSQEIEIGGWDAVELKRIQQEKPEFIRKIFLRTTHHNDQCICGSGRKFRKCCRSSMLAAGPV